MAIPTAYTENEAATYVHGELGPVATALGWTVADSYGEVVNDTLLEMGLSDVSEVTGSELISAFRALLLLFAWRKVARAVALDVDFSADGTEISRSQAHDMATAEIKRLEGVTSRWQRDNFVSVQRIDRPHDPYADWDDTERVP